MSTYSVVLIRGDGGKSSLLENKGLVIFLGVFLTVFPGIHVDHVESGLVSVHWVQYDLQKQYIIEHDLNKNIKKQALESGISAPFGEELWKSRNFLFGIFSLLHIKRVK